MINDIIDNYESDIIKKTQELIQIPSINSTKSEKYPFGENINKALEYMLNLGTSLGFRTKNIDGYCCYIEFGEGEELVGIIGHLDVVPEGEGWTYPPFSGTIINNKIYGRGSIDDKGPIIASLYAMKSIMDNCKLHKRVRLILGLNEELDWKCIDYYKKHEEIPSIGFSPDADFPCIYGEKSILSCSLKTDLSNMKNKAIFIKDATSYDNAINVVPKLCSVVLQIDTKKLLMCEVIEQIKSLICKFDFEIDIYKISEEELKLTSHGIQAHSAHPDLGKNAISPLIILLNKLFENYNISIELFDFFNKYIGTQYDGKNLDINFEDESGKLTLNVAQISFEKNIFKISMNLRIPVHTLVLDVGNAFLKKTANYLNVDFDTIAIKDCLLIDKNNNLVQTLCNIYNETMHTDETPIAIGGATFARAFPNCISFGPNFPNSQDMCHQVDEFISIPNLMFCTKLYAKAIYELGK